MAYYPKIDYLSLEILELKYHIMYSISHFY